MTETPQMQQGSAAEAFSEEQPFYPPSHNRNIEREIADKKWRIVFISDQELDHCIENVESMVKAYSGDTYVFESQAGKESFFERAHPKDSTRVSMTGYVIDQNGSNSHSIFKEADAFICLGSMNPKIMRELGAFKAETYTDTLDFNKIIHEREILTEQRYGHLHRPKCQDGPRLKVIGG